MPKIVDQYNGDPLYAELHVLTRDYPLARTMLKTAQFEENKTVVDSLPSSAFAWADERRFPVHTREDAIASIFYRTKCAFHVPKEVDQKLAMAAEIYQIDRTAFQPVAMKKVATPTDYALPEEKRLPLSGVSHIKMAEEVLLRDYKVLSLEKRAEAFQNLYKASKRFHVQLAPLSLKMAGVTGSNVQFVREWLEARSTVATDETHKMAYQKLASALENAPNLVMERDELVKLAGTIAQLDQMAGLQKYYDRKLPDPLQTVFNMDKVAEAVVDVAGVQVPVSTLMAVPADVWAQVDAPELADVAAQGDPATFMNVFNTLPLDVKMTLRENVAHA